jgi:hypothetical protein
MYACMKTPMVLDCIEVIVVLFNAPHRHHLT